MVSTSNSIFCLLDGNHCLCSTPCLWKPRGVHLFSIPGLSPQVVTFLSPCSYADKFKKTRTAIKQPWRKAPNRVTLFNQSQRLTRAHPCCGFTGRVKRTELCSAGGWLAWSSLPCLGELQLLQPQSPRCWMLLQPPQQQQGCRAASPPLAGPALLGTASEIIISQRYKSSSCKVLSPCCHPFFLCQRVYFE